MCQHQATTVAGLAIHRVAEHPECGVVNVQNSPFRGGDHEGLVTECKQELEPVEVAT